MVEISGEIIAVIYKNETNGYTICDIVIDPAYQGRGLGTEIMNRLLTYLENQTPENGRVSVQLIAEKGKETFYKKFGFQSVPNESSGSGMRMIVRK